MRICLSGSRSQAFICLFDLTLRRTSVASPSERVRNLPSSTFGTAGTTARRRRGISKSHEVFQHFHRGEADVVAAQDDHSLAVSPGQKVRVRPVASVGSRRRRGYSVRVAGLEAVGWRDLLPQAAEKVVRLAAPIARGNRGRGATGQRDLAALDRFHPQRRILEVLFQRDVPVGDEDRQRAAPSPPEPGASPNSRPGPCWDRADGGPVGVATAAKRRKLLGVGNEVELPAGRGELLGPRRVSLCLTIWKPPAA